MTKLNSKNNLGLTEVTNKTQFVLEEVSLLDEVARSISNISIGSVSSSSDTVSIIFNGEKGMELDLTSNTNKEVTITIVSVGSNEVFLHIINPYMCRLILAYKPTELSGNRQIVIAGRSRIELAHSEYLVLLDIADTLVIKTDLNEG